MIIHLLIGLLVLLMGLIVGFIVASTLSLNTKYVGPNSSDIKKKVYFDDVTGQCYKLIPEVCIST
jgi:hypothetical protein